MAIGSYVTSTMGMHAQSHALEQISSNIANVNTVGYKKVDARFETQMSKYNEIGTDSHYFTAGNVDRRMVDIAGILDTTNSIYDLGISGRGFFVVQGDNNTYYTRAGDFQATAVTPAGYKPQQITYYKPTNGSGVITQSKPASYFVNASGCYVMGWNYNADSEAFSSSLEPVVISPNEYTPGHLTTTMSFKGNIPADATESQLLKFGVYDNDYTMHNMTMRWTKTDNTNTWNVEIGLDGGASVTSGTIEVQFDENARMIKPAAATTIAVDWGNGSAGNISLDLSHFTQYATHLQGSVLSQDGKGFGSLVSTSWDAQGVLNAVYSNGASIPVCKVAVAQVQVPNMMEAVSGNMFEYSENAGNLEIVDLQATRTETTVEGGKLEGSNVSLEEEFTNMVTTQRAYSSSVNAFTTVNEMVQEAISILT